MKRGVLIAVWFGLALFAAAWFSGCKHDTVIATKDAGASAFFVRPDSEGLLLTWIDDKGDFHVETKVADVPMMGRDTVRVVDPTKDSLPDDSQILCVDLRQTRADGTYSLHSMRRADFDAIAVARREQKGPTLVNAAPPAPSDTPPSAGASSQAPAAKSANRGVVIIYGAEWCSACHDAARYLRKKGIAYVEKDIEKDPAAAREMEMKLSTRGMQSGSIPVIDVRGNVMVGFSAPAIDNALGNPL